MTAPVPVPTPAAVEAAFAEHGSNIRAAAALGLVSRTLERQLARYPSLHFAAERGRVKYVVAHAPAHGTPARYSPTRFPCDCVDCRAANATRVRESRS